MLQKNVQSTAHGKIERSQPACPAQVHLIHAVVTKAGRSELPHAKPFQIHCNHATLGLVDAPHLFVVGGHAVRTVMSIDVHHNGHFSGQFIGFVE